MSTFTDWRDDHDALTCDTCRAARALLGWARPEDLDDESHIVRGTE